MQPRLLIVIASLLFFDAFSASVFADFITISVPGLPGTQLAGIDANGLMYGSAAPSINGPYQGYTYDGNTYSTLNFPGAVSTSVTGKDGGTFVGTRHTPGETISGFSYDGNVFQKIEHPLATPRSNGTTALDVDGNRIVGGFLGEVNGIRGTYGYVYDGTDYTTIERPPGANFMSAIGIEGDTIVGNVQIAGSRSTGYILKADNFTVVEHPLGDVQTTVLGITDGIIYGSYTSADVTTHGFLLRDGEFTNYDVPSELGFNTSISGVLGDTIVGTYLAPNPNGVGTISQGFVFRLSAVPEPSSFSVMLLGLCGLSTCRRRRVAV